jgi:hypothetical protein
MLYCWLVCPYRLVRPRTPVFQAGDAGSNPAGGTSSKIVLRARALHSSSNLLSVECPHRSYWHLVSSAGTVHRLKSLRFRRSILRDRIGGVPLTLTLIETRRLAVASQLLAGKRPPRTRRGILETVRALRHLQLDPTAAVAPSHLLVLWSLEARSLPPRRKELCHGSAETLSRWYHCNGGTSVRVKEPVSRYPCHAAGSHSALS